MSVRGYSWVEQNKKDLDDLVWRFKRAQGKSGTPTPCGRVLVITGAGCSASAGIPTARQIAQECVVDLLRNSGYRGSLDELGTLKERATAAMVKLVEHGTPLQAYLPCPEAPEPPWGELYEHLFTKVYNSPREQKRVIEGFLARGHGLNWAHVCLGELMRHSYVHTVLTVNFDLLALEGAIRAGVIPVIADGLEGLSRVDSAPTHPQIVYYHGTRHNYMLRNAAQDVNKGGDDPEAIRVVRNLVRDSDCILVVGYSAADTGLAKILQQSLSDYRNRLVWTDLHSPSAQAHAMCDSCNATLLAGVDADELFRELLRGLGLGAPQWIQDPLKDLSEVADRLRYGEDSNVKRVVEKLRERIARCRDLMREGPDSVELGLSLAAHLRLAGQDSEAIGHLRRLRIENPESSSVLRALGDTLVEAGKGGANSALLAEAVETLKECVKLVPREADEKVWAQTQSMLGRALFNLGQWEEGTAPLKEAVRAFRAALEVHTRERLPLDWARGQNDLGTALRSLADREEGTVHLKKAVKAFRAALEEHTREERPDHWATTKTNLGDALTNLGHREEGITCLEEAVITLREVLEVRTREERPAAWARTQHYLGDALRNLGNREEGKTRLQEAVMAYRAALTVRTRKREPLYWARTQDKLGRALASLGNGEEGTARLNQAIRAYRQALQERSHRGPIRDRADTQCNFGDALAALGSRTKDTARLKEAIVAFRLVLECPKLSSTAYAARAQAGLANAEKELRELV